MKAATSATSSLIPPVHGLKDAFLGDSLSPVAVVVGLAAPLALCLYLGFSRDRSICRIAAVMTFSIWVLAVWSAFHLNGPPYAYLLAWAGVAPVPCWIALIVTGLNHRAKSTVLQRSILAVTIVVGILAGFCGPTIEATGDPQVLTTAARLASVIPKDSSAMFSTSSQEITTFSFLVGVANELDRHHFHVMLENHPFETSYSQFAPTKPAALAVKFLPKRIGDVRRPGYFETVEGLSIFITKNPSVASRR
jgi:hypothetical protein